MKTLGITHSMCDSCRVLVPAKIVSDGRDVFCLKFCKVHGEKRSFIRSDVQDYLATLRYIKPAWVPEAFAGDAGVSCVEGCGFCERHEQHLCMPIIEITSRCDLTCPVCLVDAGQPWDITLDSYRRVLAGIVRAEKQIDVLNLSGGEPLLHPHLLAILDETISRPEIVRVSISTNGLRLLSDGALVRELRKRDVVISLQFDGFKEETYRILRGRPLLQSKRRILDLLATEDSPASLTMTAARGVNDDQFPPMLEYLFSHDNISSITIQPVAFTGRAVSLPRQVERLSIPDVIRALGNAGHPSVSACDFVPLPCAHPLCVSLAFYLVPEEGDAVSVNRLVDAGTMLDCIANRVYFGLDSADHEDLKDLVYRLWSGPSGIAPDSEAVLETLRCLLREVCCSPFDARKAFAAGERKIKSIFIHAFQDAETFDLARARQCCNAYPQEDGRIVPACVYNLFYRSTTPGADRCTKESVAVR